MTPTEIRFPIVVHCEVELIRRGIERAARSVDLSITDTETQAAFVVRDASQPIGDLSARPVVTVDDGAVQVAAACALDPALWVAVGRLANEVLGNPDPGTAIEPDAPVTRDDRRDVPRSPESHARVRQVNSLSTRSSKRGA